MADGATIVSLFADRPGVTDTALARIEQYWETLRRGRAVPRRTDVSPDGLTGALDTAFVLERIAPGTGRFRVAGQSVVVAAGLDLRGLPLSVCFAPDARNRLRDVVEDVFAKPAVLRAALTSPGGLGRAVITADLLLLPLLDDSGHVTRALGGLAVQGTPRRRPRRFEITGTVLRPVSAARVAGPNAKVLPFRR